MNPLLSVLPFYLPFCHWISSHSNCYPCRVQVNKAKLVAALLPSNQLYSPSHNLSPFYHLQTTSLAMWQQSILAICMGTGNTSYVNQLSGPLMPKQPTLWPKESLHPRSLRFCFIPSLFFVGGYTHFTGRVHPWTCYCFIKYLSRHALHREAASFHGNETRFQNIIWHPAFV